MFGDVRCLASIEGPTGTRLCSCVQVADGLCVVEVPHEHFMDALLIPDPTAKSVGAGRLDKTEPSYRSAQCLMPKRVEVGPDHAACC